LLAQQISAELRRRRHQRGYQFALGTKHPGKVLFLWQSVALFKVYFNWDSRAIREGLRCRDANWRATNTTGYLLPTARHLYRQSAALCEDRLGGSRRGSTRTAIKPALIAFALHEDGIGRREQRNGLVGNRFIEFEYRHCIRRTFAGIGRRKVTA
jgi:hypothetical protein